MNKQNNHPGQKKISPRLNLNFFFFFFGTSVALCKLDPIPWAKRNVRTLRGFVSKALGRKQYLELCSSRGMKTILHVRD